MKTNNVNIKPHPGKANSKIPFYGALSGYEWVDGYIKCAALKEKMAELRKERDRVSALESSKEEFLGHLHASFEAYNQRRLDKIKIYLIANRRSPDPMLYFESYAKIKDLQPYVSWEEIERIAKRDMPDWSGINSRDRMNQLAKIDQALAKDKTRLAELSPSKYFMTGKARILADIREEFVNSWFDLQYNIIAAVGPGGVELAASSDAEIAAWKKLGLDKAVNPEGAFRPCPF